ncbi:MAG: M20/M25/M40 family metallo-hydrolase [Thermoleophilia bacterium]|nr:M20/M25/M40 family metallo-hydrolase [Thermoleophilia bacterium]
MGLSELEQRVVDAIAARSDELVAFAAALVGFDTTARELEDPPREEAALQAYLAARLAAAGASVEVFEPSRAEVEGKPLVPPGLGFTGRPQLVARFVGAGGGKSLLFNGHIDAVSYEPRGQWTSDPLAAEVRDGMLYGRGSCDMKGGVAAMAFAAETLASLGIRLAGDLVVATNTDEESSGAGSQALVQHGVSADAGIVTEATGFTVWVACRGSEYGEIVVPGRTGHAEVEHGHWHDGGAVNAIEKAMLVLAALQSLRENWRKQHRFRHPYLSVPDIVPTMVKAGEWAVTYPAECRIGIAVLYQPVQADADGWGSDVRAEVEGWVARAAAADSWLAEHPPRIEWWPNGVMPMEIPEDEPIVAVMREVNRDLGLPDRLHGLDSWYDGATFTQFAATPSIGYGPAGFSPDGAKIAHTIDEHVPVDDLVTVAQALAVAALRFCGTA